MERKIGIIGDLPAGTVVDKLCDAGHRLARILPRRDGRWLTVRCMTCHATRPILVSSDTAYEPSAVQP